MMLNPLPAYCSEMQTSRAGWDGGIDGKESSPLEPILYYGVFN